MKFKFYLETKYILDSMIYISIICFTLNLTYIHNKVNLKNIIIICKKFKLQL